MCAVKEWLKPFVSITDIISDSIIWLKIEKKLFESDIDIYVAFTYIPPEGSVFHSAYNIDIFDILEDSIAKYTSLGRVVVMGDLNSRCGTVADFIEADEIDAAIQNHVLSVLSYIPDAEIPKRSSEDLSINFHGRALISLCKSARMRILNGRDHDNITGKVTFCNARGTSLIDYVLVEDAFLQEKICSFSVGDFNEYSDHTPIYLTLKIQKHGNYDHSVNIPTTTHSNPIRVSWNPNAIDDIKNKLNDVLQTS